MFFLFWVINHSRPYFHYKRLVHGQQKANMVLDNVMYLGKQIAFCAPTTRLFAFLIEEACAWTTKNIRSCNISTKNEYIQTIGDFSAGNKPFCFFSASLLSLLLCFSAFVLLCLSTLLFYIFFSSVMCYCCSTSCSSIFTASCFSLSCCFILSFLYPKWNKWNPKDPRWNPKNP